MSRFITVPDFVAKENYTVTLIDPTPDEIEQVGLFCAASDKDYDIYLYNGDWGDLQYLQTITELSDKVLINDNSKVSIVNCAIVERVGADQTIKAPLDYFQSLNG